MSDENAIKTALYDEHIKLGARMAPFGGFDMPIQYSGIIKEHEATRKSTAIFDTCHMGEFEISGPNATADLDKILTSPMASMDIGQCRYGFICNEDGGVIDDEITYKMADDKYFIVVNAGTQDYDFEWFEKHISSDTKIANLSKETAKLDLQGPESVKMILKMLSTDISDLKFYRHKKVVYKGVEVLVSRTGYTGEIGFEIYLPNKLGVEFWQEAISLGATPAGLGCRDTLRLEMGYPLYGHELDNMRNPAESGFKMAISKEKEFIGSSVVLDETNVKQKLCGVVLEGRRSAREGFSVLNSDGGEEIGKITSGSFSPSLQKAIAFAYIDIAHSIVGSEIFINIGKKNLKAKVVEIPFYKDGTCRKAITKFI